MVKKKRCIITFCAHNDDQIIGAGGTIKKYVDSGIKAYTYIFSYGEMSHPHLKPEVIAKTRKKESIRASKVLGDKVNYLGLKEGKFIEQCNIDKIKKIINKHKPEKIFIHSPDDPHPDHRAVFKIMTKLLNNIKYKGNLYCFDVWNIFSFRTRSYPKLFIDISETFNDKVNSFNMHKSQFMAKILIGWSIYTKAIIHGWNNHCKYAELFHRIEINKDNNYIKNGK
jgi:N-acetylglucosamine malate deacetylase 1